MMPDFDWLARTHAACFKYPRPWRAEEFRDLQALNTCALVIEEHGFALARVVLHEAEILTIAVLPGARRKGVGRALMAALETRLRTLNTTQVFLEVSAENQAAMALYRACGFTQKARRTGYYTNSQGPSQDALILCKMLG